MVGFIGLELPQVVLSIEIVNAGLANANVQPNLGVSSGH
jgi:hypothetical protein